MIMMIMNRWLWWLLLLSKFTWRLLQSSNCSVTLFSDEGLTFNQESWWMIQIQTQMQIPKIQIHIQMHMKTKKIYNKYENIHSSNCSVMLFLEERFTYYLLKVPIITILKIISSHHYSDYHFHQYSDYYVHHYLFIILIIIVINLVSSHSKAITDHIQMEVLSRPEMT